MISTPPDYVVTFGDSLSDSGAIFALTDAVLIDPFVLPVPEPFITPGYAGVFSDGPVHVQGLAGLLGAELAGYAAGSARAVGTRTVLEAAGDSAVFIDPMAPAELVHFDLNLGGQVARFLGGEPPFPGGAVPMPAPGDTVLATYFIGLNDVGDFAAAAADNPFLAILQAPGFLSNLIGSATAGLNALADSGLVDQVAVYTLPDIKFFPIPPGVDASALDLVEGIIDTYDVALRLAALEISGRVETVLVEVDEITDEIDADPTTFGFLAKGPFYLGGGADPTITPPPPGSPPGTLPEVSFPVNPLVEDIPLRQLQFFDFLHFSAATHGILAAFGEASITKDQHFLGDGDNLRFAFGGEDLVLAQAGNDFVSLGSGDDVGLGGLGNDTVFGNSGSDIISGGSGSDLLRGGSGDDFLAGGAGDDHIRGGGGHDILLDGQGGDDLRGQSGDDTFVWIDPVLTGGTGGGDIFRGNGGTDRLYLIASGATAAALQAELDAQTGAGGSWSFATAGVEARTMEEVIVLDGGIDALGLVEAGNADLLAEGLLWGFV